MSCFCVCEKDLFYGIFFFIKKFRIRLLLFCLILLNVCFFVNECFKGVDLDSVIIKDMYKML